LLAYSLLLEVVVNADVNVNAKWMDPLPSPFLSVATCALKVSATLFRLLQQIGWPKGLPFCKSFSSLFKTLYLKSLKGLTKLVKSNI